LGKLFCELVEPKTERTQKVTDFQREKELVLDLYAKTDGAEPGQMANGLRGSVTNDYRWYGYHPFGTLEGAEQVASVFWEPLKQSLTRLQRRQDVFFAGRNEMDGFQSIWVVSMGHFMGLFDTSWLGIRPTQKLTFLRYCEFNKVVDGRIAETALYIDIPHFMIQAGQNPFPLQTGAHLVQPGPAPHNGLLFDLQPPAEGQATLEAINAMIKDIGQWQSELPLEDELARSWHDDMIWWGPAGIGATYTIERYAKQHSGPFRAAFSNRSKTNHICRLAEGQFGGFFGWPNFTATHDGGFMGMPATGKSGEFRVMDIYRREDGKLAENWIFIDLLHFWKSQGVDILARTMEING
jgi:hypothetical protein